MPCTALLWRHRSLEVRLRNLEERHVRLQHQMGRIIETLASWDSTVATMFSLSAPPTGMPTGGSCPRGGAGSRGSTDGARDSAETEANVEQDAGAAAGS